MITVDGAIAELRTRQGDYPAKAKPDGTYTPFELGVAHGWSAARSEWKTEGPPAGRPDEYLVGWQAAVAYHPEWAAQRQKDMVAATARREGERDGYANARLWGDRARPRHQWQSPEAGLGTRVPDVWRLGDRFVQVPESAEAYREGWRAGQERRYQELAAT